MKELKDLNDYEQMETDEAPKPKTSPKNRTKFFIFIFITVLILIIGIYAFKKMHKPQVKAVNRRLIILGIGPVSQTVLALLDEKLKFKEYIIYDKVKDENIKDLVSSGTKISVIQKEFHMKNFTTELLDIFQENDIIFDIFSRHQSIDVIRAASQKKNILYFNAGLEDLESKYGVCGDFEVLFKYMDKNKPIQTMMIGSGANPGMITHFVRLGLIHMAEDAIKKNVKDSEKLKELLKKKNNEADLAEQLQIETVHVSELETNDVDDEKVVEGFATNSWSIETFIEECILNGEVSLNKDDLEYFNKKNVTYEKIPYFDLMYSTPSETYLKTAYPFGTFTGKVTTHEEIIEISELLSNKNHKISSAFVYHPSRLGRKTLKYNQEKPRKVFTEENCGPLKGFEIMGATIISKREDIPARWYGSIVSCEESRRVGCKTNPTTLQVAAGLYAHLLYALDHPNMGIVFPHHFDSEIIMEYAKPYLGIIYDMNLPFNISYKCEDLVSTEQDMNYDI